MDTQLLQLIQRLLRTCHIVFDATADATVITEVIDGLKRRGVHCVRTYQFLGIEDVAIGWILRAGTSPEWPLHMCTDMPEPLEARRTEDPLEVLVNQAGVGNRSLTLQ